MTQKEKVGIDLGLTAEEKEALHRIALSTIQARLQGKPLPDIVADAGILTEKRGAFVSLHRKGCLRGCIGYIRAEKPLYKTIQEMSLSAAFQDPRFEPLGKDELEDLQIEISVLTPMEPVTDIRGIEVGRHGLMIVKGYHSGLLLPQVAVQYGWDRETFLEHTCLKAGLPQDAWKDGEVKIYAFSADVF